MKEFAAKGYDHASTNKIVEDACIAKGLLFHYFKSKKQLFLYLYQSCVQMMSDVVLSKVDFDEADLFKRLHGVQIAKFDLIRIHPDIIEFIQGAYVEQSVEVRAELSSY